VLPSAFNSYLAELVQALPGAEGAIFVDWEGEAVDRFDGSDHETPIRLVGAHWGIIYYLFRSALERADAGKPQHLVLTFSEKKFIIYQVTPEYLIVVTMRKDVNLSLALDMCRVTVRRLQREM
jgi:predicted regulator of Ras-like GTPase activity (Roadblock/LC7/MglB family)